MYTVVSDLDCNQFQMHMHDVKMIRCQRELFTHQTETVHKATSSICMSKHVLRCCHNSRLSSVSPYLLPFRECLSPSLFLCVWL